MQLDAEGEIVILENTETKWSCQDWIKLEPGEFKLKPHERKQVRATLTVPPLAEGGKYTCLVFESHKEGEKQALSTSFQIPVLLTIPKQTDFKGEIVKSELKFSQQNPPSLVTYFKNLGNIHFKPRGKVIVKSYIEIAASQEKGVVIAGSSKYEKIGEFAFKEAKEFVLPEGISKLETTFPSMLHAGKYVAEIDVEYGGKTLVQAQKAFVIK